MLAGLAASGCVWIHPTEPERALPSSVAVPRFEEVAVDFAHRWDRKTSHHLTGAAVLDVDGDGREEVFGGGAGQPNALLGLRDGRLLDGIQGTGLESQGATYGSCAIDLDGDSDVDLIVAHNRGVTLYVNEAGAFQSQALPVDLPVNSVPLAIAVSDIDHDGDGDLYLSVFVDFPHFVPATFNVPEHAKQNRLLRNDGNLRFTDITTPVTASKQNTFTSLFVDLDGDRTRTSSWPRTPGRWRSCATPGTAASPVSRWRPAMASGWASRQATTTRTATRICSSPTSASRFLRSR
jgi:hypothetical protein